MKRIMSAICWKACASASGSMGVAPGRMNFCPFEENENVSCSEEEKDTELRISFQGGRLDALCQLIVDGVITLDEALPYAGIVEEELKELYESWKWFSEGEQEGSDE